MRLDGSNTQVFATADDLPSKEAIYVEEYTNKILIRVLHNDYWIFDGEEFTTRPINDLIDKNHEDIRSESVHGDILWVCQKNAIISASLPGYYSFTENTDKTAIVLRNLV
ncbi:MAG: hypothetical protein GC180_12305 [Bacteroidetes bacterium]|nr:hypothetical protein [Bacteroidota bacterium]